jgi:transcription antitermination factor NusG
MAGIEKKWYVLRAIGGKEKKAKELLDNEVKMLGLTDLVGESVVPVERVYQQRGVRVDYLRAPYYYTLTQDQLDEITDKSMIIEFPDYVVYEIINTLVKLILENGGNPRIQTHMGANQSIV